MPRQNKLQDLPENCTQIFVRGPTEKTYGLHVDPNSTLKDIKAMLSDKTGVPAKFLFFIWGGKILPDNETLESLNIPHDATLSCNARVIGQSNSQIRVRLYGRIVEINCDGLRSVLDLKTKLRIQEEILGKVLLVFDGKLLEDNETLSNFGNSRIGCIEMETQPAPRYLLEPPNVGLSNGDTLEWASPKRSRIKIVVEDWLAVGIRGWPPIGRAKKIAAFRGGIRAA
jgi:hypothetical protein